FTGAKNSALTKLTIPSSLKYKGKSYKVTQIAEGALKNYTKLKSVVIGKNITTIGKEAFASCKNLTLINIQSTLLKKVGAKALSGINKKAVIKVPAKKLKTYKILLSNKGQSKTVKVK
ncbi:Leucine rich repeat-containing protein, partial [Acetitomaculum ruminis DSM 5522]